MKYDPLEETCFDPDTETTVAWAGGSGAEGNEWRGFKVSHADWEVVLRFYVFPFGIHKNVQIGDLSKNEVKISTTYDKDARVELRPFGDPKIVYGEFDENYLSRQTLDQALQCLYSRGGRDPVQVIL